MTEEQFLNAERQNYYKVKSEVDTKFEGKLMQLIGEGKIVDLSSQPTEVQRKWLINRFYENREKAYYALQLNQKAIDAPKTLALPDKNDIETLKSYTSLEKHPRFMYYHKFTKNKDAVEVDWYDTEQTNCALDITADEINKELIKPIKEAKKKIADNPARLRNLLKEYAEENAKCIEEIAKTKKYHKLVGDEAKKIKDKQARDEFWAEEKLKIIDNIKVLRQIYTDKEIAHALVFNECSVTFIMNYAWDIVEAVINAKERKVYIYAEAEDGDIDWMFKKYKKKLGKLVKGNLQETYIEMRE